MAELVARAVLDALAKSDPGAIVRDRVDGDLTEVTIDGRFNLVEVARAAIAVMCKPTMDHDR